MRKEHDGMIRVQVQFPPEEYQRIRKTAARRGVSMAQVVREGVEAYLATPTRDRWEAIFDVAGKYGDDGSPKDVGREHDRYLEEAYEDWREST